VRHAQERLATQIVRRFQALRQRRRAHRRKTGGEQLGGREIRPVAGPEPNTAGPVVVIGHGRAARRKPHFDGGRAPLEIGEPRNKPARREGRTDPDGEHVRARHRRDLLGEEGELVENVRQPRLVGAAGGGEHQAIGLALEQRDAEPLFEQLHHAADRGRRHVQLAGRPRETRGARRCLEGADAVQERQLAHGGTPRKADPDQG
jgi:hypothetical protein